MKYDTAGDPITGLKWTRKTTRKIAALLQAEGIVVGHNTVGKLLKQLNYSLKVNDKKLMSGIKDTPEKQADKDKQFKYIGQMRTQFAQQGAASISVDTKKKELIGNFKNPGKQWCIGALPVNDHDFRSDAIGIGIPYGIYDIDNNRGCVFVGTSKDTAFFAVDVIQRWWQIEGNTQYAPARHLLILADSGGSNGYRLRAWKYAIQQQLCNRCGLSVTVCHYPPGKSKYNPIEHRLFSEISKNWAGMPLIDYETMLNYIATTQTTKGLKVNAYFVGKQYETGRKISDNEFESINLHKHEVLPQWNYTITPH